MPTLELITSPPERSSALDLDDGFGHWLAGFIDGEGCFSIFKTRDTRRKDNAATYRCVFRLNLRDDDRQIVEEAQRRTGLGRITFRVYKNQPNTNPQVGWIIDGKQSCRALAEILDRYPLRAKKARDYAIWRKALDAWGDTHQGAKNTDWSRMAALKDEIEAVRAYHPEAA